MDENIVKTCFKTLMESGLGLDLSDPNLEDTPGRVARMFCREFFSSVGHEFEDFKTFPNTHGYNTIIISDKIHFVSVCSHHFLPFMGFAWILYIPNEHLIGASKMARLVEHYSRRPQIQENLCHEIMNAFVEGVEPKGAMVVMRAVHNCMACRGVKQYADSGLGTSAVFGDFSTHSSLETKGYELIKLSLMV